MATDLLDIKVWLALVDENHQHHASARDYWEQHKADRVAFCRVSMLGLLRLSTQTRVLSRALNQTEFTKAICASSPRIYSILSYCFYSYGARINQSGLVCLGYLRAHWLSADSGQCSPDPTKAHRYGYHLPDE